MKVLIVDDSNAMRMIIKRTLRQAGFESWVIEEASNGVEALASIQSSGPDLVLADWNMPEMSGYELLEQLKQTGAKVKFGFITSESTPEMKKKAEDAGALFLITKPFTADIFKEILTTVLA
jgi:two-component system, chemotaxis family, chemotaxis protein CheY